MIGSHAHHYRGYMVEIGIHRMLVNTCSGGYLITHPVMGVAGYGETPLMPNKEMAEKVALSLALAAVDEKLRGESDPIQSVVPPASVSSHPQ